jgi:autotransporter family porin
MTRTSGPRRPALRPTAVGVMLALTALSTSAALARELNGEAETIDDTHTVEEWRLINGAQLTVDGGSTNTLSVHDTSTAILRNATVTRKEGAMSTYSMLLQDGARAIATSSHFIDGGIWVAGNSSAELIGSSVTMHAADLVENARAAWGFSLNTASPDEKPTLLLDATRVSVADRPDEEHYSSGIGAYMRAGELTLRNRSEMEAANVGVIAHGSSSQNHALTLRLDNSHIAGGRGSAIEFNASQDAENTFDVLIANGSTLSAGDNNLLHVRAYRDTPTTGHNDINFTVDDSRLEGDIRFDDTHMQGSVDVVLRNRARLTGRFFNVTTAAISGDSTWVLSGDSSVGHLQLDDGTVALGDGSRFNTLSLDSFSGDGGTLVFNAKLEGDDSLADRLVISGDAEGQANVRVNNVGGQGAQTDKGIELITIGGQSDARFDLQGRAAGGLYDYFLFKDGNGNWYLRSEWREEPEAPDECELDPTAPHCEVTLPVEPGEPDPETPDPEDPNTPEPVLRPETGAYLANHAAVGQLLQHSARERRGATTQEDGARTWASVAHADARMDVSGQQHLRTQRSRLQAGVDIAGFDGGRGHVGAMLGASQADATSRSRVTGYAARASVEGGSAGVYAQWSHKATTLDATVQYGQFRNRVAGDGLAAERYDSAAWQATLDAQHRVALGQVGSMAVQLQPELTLTWTALRMDRHVERNGTVIAPDEDTGLSTRLGLRLEGEAAFAAGQFQPYVAIHADQKHGRSALMFDGERIEGGQPRHRVTLSTGGRLQFGNRVSGWMELSAGRGSERYRDAAARLGVQYRW